MIPSGLSLDQAPPLSVPFRFFVTGCAFGLGAALLLALRPDMLAGRWMPLLLATTHAFLLGFLVMIMLGALQQMLPVVAGAPVLATRVTGGLVHVAWTAGTVALAAGLGTGRGAVTALGATLLVAGAVTFLVSASRLLTTRGRGDTVMAVRLALVALAIAVALGATLAAGHAGLTPLRRFTLTDVHLGWALAGWVSLLIAGVSWQVVPMLLMTPAYPAWCRRATLAIVPLLAAWSLLPLHWTGVRVALEVVVAAVLATHAGVTLRLLAQRRRAVPDATAGLFRFASGALVVACMLHALRATTGLGGARLGLAIVLLHAVAFASAVAAGMLLKIVPFLAWFHLQAHAGRQMMAGEEAIRVPMMKDVVSDARARLVARVHVAACVLIVLAPLHPRLLGTAAGLALAGSLGLLLATTAGAWRLVARTMRPAAARVTETGRSA